MKDKFIKIKTKKYLVFFSLVMLLNILLTLTFVRVSIGQIEKDDLLPQQTVKVEVMEQKDSPLQITVVSIDNSPLSYQDIIFKLQNIGNKPIKAYTVLGDGKRNGKTITSFFTAKRFLASESIINNFDVERQNTTEDEIILLSVDYVEFEDGSFWGTDNAGKSEEIAGQREGTKAVIMRLKDIIKTKSSENTNNIVNFLKQDIQEIVIDVPDKNHSDKWQKGFKLGYKSVISILKREEEQKIAKIAEKLNEIDKITNEGGK